MDSEFFNLPIPKEVKKMVSNAAAGRQFRFPPTGSKWNPIDREERNSAICRDRLKGMALGELGIKYKLKKRWLQMILKANGITYKKEKLDRTDEIRTMLTMGMKKKDIAKKLDISRPTLDKWIKKGGLQ